MIEFKNVYFAYNKDYVLSDVNLNISKNSVIGIIGPNGSGKTTLIRLILGIINPIKGEILISEKLKAGVVLDNLSMYPDISVEKNLKIVCTVKQCSYNEIDVALEKVGLLNKKKSKVKTLSLGMKQRLSIASALLGNPEMLILDEPTTGLDPQGIVEIRMLITKIAGAGKTIIIASHILAELEKVCTDIAFINKGNMLYVSSINNIINEYNSLEKAYLHLNQ